MHVAQPMLLGNTPMYCPLEADNSSYYEHGENNKHRCKLVDRRRWRDGFR